MKDLIELNESIYKQLIKFQQENKIKIHSMNIECDETKFLVHVKKKDTYCHVNVTISNNHLHTK